MGAISHSSSSVNDHSPEVILVAGAFEGLYSCRPQAKVQMFDLQTESEHANYCSREIVISFSYFLKDFSMSVTATFCATTVQTLLEMFVRDATRISLQ